MHTKYKTYPENQIISYSGKHYQFLSTLHLAVTCSYDLSFRAPVSAGTQYLSLDLCLWMASPSKPVGATGTWELAHHFAEWQSLKSSQGSTQTMRYGSLSLQRPLHCQQWEIHGTCQISLGLSLWVLWELDYEFMPHSLSLP